MKGVQGKMACFIEFNSVMEVSIEHPPNLQSHKWFFAAIRYIIQLLVMQLSVGSVTILLGYGNVTRGVQLGEHSKLVVEDCSTWEINGA